MTNDKSAFPKKREEEFFFQKQKPLVFFLLLFFPIFFLRFYPSAFSRTSRINSPRSHARARYLDITRNLLFTCKRIQTICLP